MINAKTMNLDYVRTFVVVGQSKDFNDAASKLNLNYTNVSRHIKALESLMGTKLIKRNSKNYIELTEDGKDLFAGYEKAYNLLFITEKSFVQKKDLNAGKISIGISADIKTEFLDDKIINFKQKYPNTIFKIINLPAKDLYEKLSHYYVDIIIDEKLELKKSSEISTQDLYYEEYAFYYDDQKYKLSTIEDLENIPLILPTSTKEERTLINNYLAENNIQKKLSIETTNYQSALNYASSGLGIALLPKGLNLTSTLKTYDLPLKKSIGLSYIKENISPTTKEFLKEFDITIN